jgi:hypothetical protein
MANGKAAPMACRESGIAEQPYYRWCKECGGLKINQAPRMKELVKENSRLKRLVAELSLDKQRMPRRLCSGRSVSECSKIGLQTLEAPQQTP